MTPITPSDPPVVSVGLPSGGREDRYATSYRAVPGSEEHPLRSTLAFVVEAGIGANALPVAFTLALIDGRRDGPGNLGTRRFTVARPEAACG